MVYCLIAKADSIPEVIFESQAHWSILYSRPICSTLLLSLARLVWYVYLSYVVEPVDHRVFTAYLSHDLIRRGVDLSDRNCGLGYGTFRLTVVTSLPSTSRTTHLLPEVELSLELTTFDDMMLYARIEVGIGDNSLHLSKTMSNICKLSCHATYVIFFIRTVHDRLVTYGLLVIWLTFQDPSFQNLEIFDQLGSET